MRCIICGCVDNRACQHEEIGNCHWFADRLCSHCADPEIFKSANRPGADIREFIVPGLTDIALRKALKLLGLNVTVSEKDAIGVGTVAVHLKGIALPPDPEQIILFQNIMRAWFPTAHQSTPGRGAFHIKLQESLPQIENNAIQP